MTENALKSGTTVSEAGPCADGGQHKFSYAGVRFRHGANPLPGSGSTRRYYAHIYFCEKCTERRGEPITGVEECSYEPVRYDATPGSAEDVGVPRYDQSYGGRY